MRKSGATRLEKSQIDSATLKYRGSLTIRRHAACDQEKRARISEAHIARAKGIIDQSLELRRATIREVPEIGSEPYFQQLTQELEQTASLIRADRWRRPR